MANQLIALLLGLLAMNFVNGAISKKGDNYIFTCADFSIDVSAEVDHLLEAYVGKEIIFGIRPEDIWDIPSSDWIKDKAIFETVVDFREIIGSETYMYVHIGKTALTTRVGGMCDASTGSNFKVAMRLNRLHFFDPKTKKAII